VAVIAIGLALTLLVAMFLLPWAWKQITELLPATATRSVGLVSVFTSGARVACAGGGLLGPVCGS
jgi:hypothetical protein